MDDETENISLDSLPLDILRDIFLRLSVESLARLALSSYFFEDFITNDLVLERVTPTVQVHIWKEKMTSSKGERLNNKAVLSKFRNMTFSNPFYLDQTFAIAGSCNGLVCFYQCSKQTADYSNQIYIWNPALHQIRALPKSIGAKDFVAFGYDSSIQDYKILRISCGKNVKAEVYSWKKNSWKMVRRNFKYVPNESSNKYIVDFEGSLYWVSEAIPSDFRVSAFDIANELLNVYKCPKCVSFDNDNTLGVFRGSLSLLAKQYYMYWEIWSFDKSGLDCPWTKTYQFHLQPEHDYPFPDHMFDDFDVKRNVYIRGLTASGKILVSSYFREYYALVDPDTISLEKLRFQPIKKNYVFIDYAESLTSVYPPPRRPQGIY